jgi:tetratricopeptide (TPR) repeat protein
LLVLLVIVTGASVARAESDWEREIRKGVSAANQASAEALYQEGNQLFGQKAYGSALTKYKAAIALWDHPHIRLNIAITEIWLDRLVDAADDLESALRFGAAPYPGEKYQQVLERKKLVDGRLGFIEVTCKQSDANILLDGKAWFTCPGTRKVRVLIGEHLVVGEASEYMPATRRLVVASGKTAHEDIALVSTESVVVRVYPSAPWKTWTLTASGVAVALGGVGLWIAGRNQMERYERHFDVLCASGGCSATLDANLVEEQLADDRDSARLKNKISVGLMIAGSTAAIVGGVWTILNRPKRVMPKLEVAPSSTGATASASWQF